MLVALKLALLEKGIRQTRMAVDLGWDPAKLSKIVNELLSPRPEDRKAIARYLNLSEGELFDLQQASSRTNSISPDDPARLREDEEVKN